MAPQLDIVQNRHPFEKLDILKGARDAQFGDMMRGNTCDVFAFEAYFAFLGRVKSADTVQQTGFAGPVGSDDGKYLSRQ
jgi:hypothetical protein